MRRRIHIETEPAGESVGTAAAGAPAAGADGDTGMTPAAEAEITALEDRVTEQEALIATLEARVAELETLVTERDTQVETERNQYLRTLADFQNFRRRNEEQRGELVQFAAREFVLGLLPVLDNFERALAAADKNQS